MAASHLAPKKPVAGSAARGHARRVTATLPPGLRWRRPTTADAVPILALVHACEQRVAGQLTATLPEVAADLVAPGVDNERGGWLVTDAATDPPATEAAESGGETVVGWCWTRLDGAADSVFVDAYSQDGHILRWLVEQGTGYARQLATQAGRPLTVAAGSYATDTTYATVLEHSGLAVVRSFWHLRMALHPDEAVFETTAPTRAGPGTGTGSDAVTGLTGSAATPAPAGLRIRTVDDTDPADLALLHGLYEESFADHWDHTARDFASWRRRIDASAGRDPSQWWVAEIDAAPAGLLIASDARAERGETHIATLGVLPGRRGQGVGTALLRHAFADAARRGRTHVSLEVDSGNATGATRLYESVGMRVDTVLLAWQATINPGDR